jgi:hypothetical protein
MSVTMMSRLMLNLHAVESTGIFSTTDPYTTTETAMLDTLWTRDLERSARGVATSDAPRPKSTQIPVDPESWGDHIHDLENTR